MADTRGWLDGYLWRQSVMRESLASFYQTTNQMAGSMDVVGVNRSRGGKMSPLDLFLLSLPLFPSPLSFSQLIKWLARYMLSASIYQEQLPCFEQTASQQNGWLDGFWRC